MKIFLQDQRTRAQGLVEYALLLALVAVVTLVILQLSGYSIRDAYCAAAEGLGADDACAREQVYCEDDFANLDNWATN